MVGNLHVNFNVSEDVTEFVHQTTESIEEKPQRVRKIGKTSHGVT